MRSREVEWEANRARQSGGTSSDAIHEMAAEIVRRRGRECRRLLDVGCGTGSFRNRLAAALPTASYTGADICRYDGFPADAAFVEADLGRTDWPIGSAAFDAVVCIETIEHVENPRVLVRELVRVTRPGGLIVVTTPNQLCWLSLLTLVVKGQFNSFQERPGQYPSHLSALLEVDLIRIAREVGLRDVEVSYSGLGRIPGTGCCWPRSLSRARRRFSDNLAISGQRSGQSVEK